MSVSSSHEAYREAGVDLKNAEAVVDIAKKAAKTTHQPWMLGGIGGFSGAFEIPQGYRQPILLCACDGVGTKLKLAFLTHHHATVGIDLVAMSVNDILVNGGQPLVFLDYVATDAIQPAQLEQILNGIAEGCHQAGCALLGGETAEMPGFYTKNEYDLAGFCVGVVEKNRYYPRPQSVKAGDVLIGLPSSGLHSNGYSLVRKIIQDHALDWFKPFSELMAEFKVCQPSQSGDFKLEKSGVTDGSLADVLLTPTKIYVQPVLTVLKQVPDDAVHAMVHVTGGGFYDNIPRVLTPELSARIDTKTWCPHLVFPFLQKLGNLSNETMWHTFNNGVGFILIVDPSHAQTVLDALADQHTPGFVMGSLVPSEAGMAQVQIQ